MHYVNLNDMDKTWIQINDKIKKSNNDPETKKKLLIELLNYYSIDKETQIEVLQLYSKFLQKEQHFPQGFDLIVDDEKNARTIMKFFLKKLNRDSESSYNGLEALKFIIENHVAIVWLDIKMPIMSGDCLCDLLRNFFNYKGIIIGTTAYIDDKSRKGYQELGMNDIIGKPLSVIHVKSWCDKVKNKG